jgi:hypothetical protein
MVHFLDGGSHFLLWVIVSINKENKIARNLTTITRYGHPIKVQSNYVVEHSFVQEEMECVNLISIVSLI